MRLPHWLEYGLSTELQNTLTWIALTALGCWLYGF